MDRLLALACYLLALICGCGAALLSLSGFIDYLIRGDWPDQSLLRIAYDHGLIRPHWFLGHQWTMGLHHVLAMIPAALVAVVCVPVFWWLGGYLARR